MNAPASCIAFDGERLIASGSLPAVVTQAKRVIDRGLKSPVLLFDAVSSDTIEIDFRGSLAEVLKRLPVEPEPAPLQEDDITVTPDAPRGRGRPRLGVVAREVTLLPRHWEWLNGQPGGASVALRKLVEEARRVNAGRDAARKSRDAAYRFMSVMACAQESFEEAARALFAIQREAFESQIASWPEDVRKHVLGLATPSFVPL
ncbi:MAG: hypothetical protein RLZZ618_2613 [Pseudomonadota bacterium]|jgi:hypothetical protein